MSKNSTPSPVSVRKPRSTKSSTASPPTSSSPPLSPPPRELPPTPPSDSAPCHSEGSDRRFRPCRKGSFFLLPAASSRVNYSCPACIPPIERHMAIELTVNGRRYTAHYDPDAPLLSVLRDELGLTGTKYGC